MFTQGRIRVIALGVADAICIALMWAFVVFAYRLVGGEYPVARYLVFWPVVPLFVVLNAALGLYHGSWMYPAAPCSPIEEMRRIFLSALITHLGVITVLVMLFQTTYGYSRAVV